MLKRALVVAMLSCAILLIPLICLKVHSQEDETLLTVPASFYNDVREKLDKILTQTEKLQMGAIQQKLDQVLANQEEIKRQLETIKIRIH